MAIATELSLDNALGHIGRSIGAELETKIREALMPHAERVVEEAAKRLCQNLKGNILGYRHGLDGDVNITLVLDGVQHKL